ncbi:C40 family peptidase [Kitasatospora sp. NPDC048407]|uniref:C40 family peptidase n=1 Tax=Kitasatospora sp. NPDC048407 TaxID=3364051 RepID=UPI0037212A4F
MPRRLLPALLLATAALLTLLPAASAPAAPVPAVRPADDPDDEAYPSAEDVARAKAEADGKAADATGLEARLAAARSELDRIGQAAEQAVEAYNGALARLAKAQQAATAAAARAAIAEAARARAADRAAGLAAEMYRQGASPQLAALDALLGSHGPSELSVQAAAVGVAGAQTRQILDDATSTAKAAARAAADTRRAETAARTAADTVRTAKDAAQQRLADQQRQVTEIGQRQDTLLAELAAARDTSVDLERQRQDALDEIAQREAEEAARQAETDHAGAGRLHPAPEREQPWSAEGAASALAFARSVIGLPYIWGGEGPQGYDCSGLTMMAWRQGGKNLTHFAADQYAESTPVTYDRLRPGDLIFWTKTGRAADIYHVAIYLGDDQMIEAPRPGTAIKQASLWIMGRPDFYARP